MHLSRTDSLIVEISSEEPETQFLNARDCVVLARHLISCLSPVCNMGIAIFLFVFSHRLSAVFTDYRGLLGRLIAVLYAAASTTGLRAFSWVLPIINGGKLGQGSAAPGSLVTGLSDVVLSHSLEIADVGNNGDKIVPVSNLKSMAYQYWISPPPPMEMMSFGLEIL